MRTGSPTRGQMVSGTQRGWRPPVASVGKRVPMHTLAARYELLRPRLADGEETTVFVVRYPRPRTSLSVEHFAVPQQLDHWCQRAGVREAIVGGFFVRPQGRRSASCGSAAAGSRRSLFSTRTAERARRSMSTRARSTSARVPSCRRAQPACGCVNSVPALVGARGSYSRAPRVPLTPRSCSCSGRSATCSSAACCSSSCFVLARASSRSWRSSCFGISWRYFAGRHIVGAESASRQAGCCRGRAGSRFWSHRRRCCAGTGAWLPAAGPTAVGTVDRRSATRSASWCCASRARIRAGASSGSSAS